MPNHRHGFSLVELSIVLVILGLLVGGVLSGQSLIRAAEIRDVGTQISKNSVAIHSFQDKYMALPGDMANAVKFWSMASGASTDAQCAALTTAATGKNTCNGNGDGRVGRLNSANDATNYEMFRAWQHMANAGLIEGSYEGVTGALNARDANVGRNVPATRIATIGITYAFISGSTGLVADVEGNTFSIGGEDNRAGQGPTWAPFLKPEELYNIDVKLDDGKPGYGKIRAAEIVATECFTTTVPSTAEYSLLNSKSGCGAYYIF
jgi:prepilin-type N-terminal cleavage/methylation domain-containing protein